VSSKNVN
jgi:hypothetical protein